ncbi:MAG TPA: AbrB family transcriptional regulator [Azospirillaceae bacterium]|nr:AbrB family transcriptional regulator [Azospirillaceae bacterium]
MLGSLVAVAASGLLGAPLGAVPARLNGLALACIGAALGGALDPHWVANPSLWVPTLSVVMLVHAAMTVGAAAAFRRTGVDYSTAFLCAVPGAMNQVAALAPELGADTRQVALSHSVRVVTVMVCIAALVAVLAPSAQGGMVQGAIGPAAATPKDLEPVAVLGLILCILAGPAVARRLGLPSPAILGAAVAVASLRVAGVLDAGPSSLAMASAQIVAGAGIGFGFRGVALRTLARTARTSVPVSIGFVAVAALAAVGLSAATGWTYTTALLVMAPGGLAEMALLATNVSPTPTVVAVHHTCRILINLLLVPLGHRAWMAASIRFGGHRGAAIVPGE